MWYILLLIIVLIAINIILTNILFNNRIISKVLSFFQIISFIIIQRMVWKIIYENFIDHFTIEGLLIFIITIISYILILFFILKTLIQRRIIKQFIKNYVPKNKIENKELLGRFKYLYYHFNNDLLKQDEAILKKYNKNIINNEPINNSKIIYSDIFDIEKNNDFERYLVVFYILGKEDKKKKLYVKKVIFNKKIFKHEKECPNCGSPVDKDKTYCEYCDTKLVDEDNIINIENIKTIEKLTMSEVLVRAKNNNLFMYLLILNLMLIPYIFLMTYILNSFKVDGIVKTLLYIVFFVIPYVFIVIIEFKIFDNQNESSKYPLLEIFVLMMIFIEIVIGTMGIIKYFIPIIIIVKSIMYLYDYFIRKKELKKYTN